ncbi:MAG TPA: hypothetical protein VFA07_18360 [Chthonomonadaceae bacterium]|nr:hypothetical protein [Chthonomonadaceae bacterium]
MEKVNKRYPPDAVSRSRKLVPAVVVLLVLAIFFQVLIDPQAKEYHKGEAGLAETGTGLNNEFLILPLLGFREAAAGLLWVRADEFFHSGDYDAILPLVRLITWLDPHADNVYVTGAWHLDYNFTDTQERSDRRYIPPAQALLDEGIRNNQNIPDIKFEKGWQNYDKIKDYPEAEAAFKSAIAGPKGDGSGVRGTDDYPYAAPIKTWHMLAHTYEKEGRIPEALDEWQQALKHTAEILKASPQDYPDKMLYSAEKNNYKEMLQRYHDRYTTTGHDHNINPTAYPAVMMPPAGTKKVGPWDVAFQPKIEVTRPKVLKISGAFNSADGARIGVRISDWDYQARPLTGAINRFDVDQSQTILVDSIAVKKAHFEREMDMSQDPKMYSFSAPTYRIILYYDPRSTAPFLQDRFGWNGEGITNDNPDRVRVDQRDRMFGTKLIDGQGGTGPIWDGHTAPWGQFGQPPRLIMVTYKVTREQMLGLKPITDKDIIPNGPDIPLNE